MNMDEGDGEADSLECLAVSSLFACLDTAGSCSPVDLAAQAGSCTQVAQCVSGCALQDDGCLLTCLDAAGAIAAAPLSSLYTCAIGICGTTAGALTPTCLSQAIAGPCAAEASNCGL